MYKGASGNLVWHTAVDRPHPSRGYIDGGPDPRDVLPDVSRLTLAQMLAEKKDLASQLLQVQVAIAEAKALGRTRALAMLGQRHQTIQQRAAAINLRLQAEKPTDKDGGALATAVRRVCDDETQRRIFRLARQLRNGTAA